MDSSSGPDRQDRRFVPGDRGQGFYPASSNATSTLGPSFHPTSSSGPGYIYTSALGSGFYPPSSNSSGYMTAPGPGYSSVAPAVPNYSSLPVYSTTASSGYGSLSSMRRDSSHMVPEICQLHVKQQPRDALHTAKDKEKVRKPIDPPPLVQLEVVGATGTQREYLQNPHLFLAAHLAKADRDEIVDQSVQTLLGSLVSSLQRLKNLENKDGAWFVFPDISVMVLGIYRLRFTLHEFDPVEREVRILGTVYSSKFKVLPAKDYKGLEESTMLTRSFAEQGVRLRLRKEPKGVAGIKRRSSGDQGPIANHPIRPAGEYPPTKRVKHELSAPTDSSANTTGYPPSHHHPSHTPDQSSSQMGSRVSYGLNEFMDNDSSTPINHTPTNPLNMYNNSGAGYNNNMPPFSSPYTGFNPSLLPPQYNPRGAPAPSLEALEAVAYAQQHFAETDDTGYMN